MSSNTPEDSDAQLLARHVQGESEAFGEIVRRHRDRLWAVALRTLGDEEEAADALQDALVSAFRKAGAFRGDAAVTTWLHRIVVNACLDRARRRSARSTVPLTEDIDDVAQAGSDPVLAQEEAQDVTAALAQLPPEQRIALTLVDMEGYSIDEAARTLEVAAGTVKSRCARGRARLVPLLAGPYGPEQPESGTSGNRKAGDRVSSSRDRARGSDASQGGEDGS